MEKSVESSTDRMFRTSYVGAEIIGDVGRNNQDNKIKEEEPFFVSDIITRKKTGVTVEDSERQHRLLSCQLIDAQEKERKRIAAELHDGISQILGAIKYKVEGIMAADPNISRTSNYGQLKNVVTDICGAMEEVRKITMALRPSNLDDLGLLLTIDWFCREFQNTYTGIRIKKRIFVDEQEFNEQQKLAGYRILQEAMNNVTKHAKATMVYLMLKKKTDGIYLYICDNGRGFNINNIAWNSRTQGFGLRNMCERAKLSGGQFRVKSDIGKGTIIQVFWPHHSGSAPTLT